MPRAGRAKRLPTPQELAAVKVPCIVAAGAGNRAPTAEYHHGYEESQWLAARLGAELVVLPGTHVPCFTHPAELAEAVRPLLRRLS